MEEEILLVHSTIKLEMKARRCAMQKQHLCSNPGRREGGEGSDYWGFTRAWKETRVWMGRLEQRVWVLLWDHHACTLLFMTHLAFVPPRVAGMVLLHRVNLFNRHLREIPVETAMNDVLL